MPLAYIRPLGESGLFHIHLVDAVDPGFGHGPGQGTDPGWGQGRPGGRPDQGLPGGGHISNRPPGSGGGGIPDNELPDHPPPTLAPGYTIVMVRGPVGKWEYAFIAPGDPPPKPLPNPPEHVGGRPPGQGMPPLPGQPLPGQPGHPSGQPIVPPLGSGPGHPSGQPVPPTATPTQR